MPLANQQVLGGSTHQVYVVVNVFLILHAVYMNAISFSWRSVLYVLCVCLSKFIDVLGMHAWWQPRWGQGCRLLQWCSLQSRQSWREHPLLREMLSCGTEVRPGGGTAAGCRIPDVFCMGCWAPVNLLSYRIRKAHNRCCQGQPLSPPGWYLNN